LGPTFLQFWLIWKFHHWGSLYELYIPSRQGKIPTPLKILVCLIREPCVSSSSENSSHCLASLRIFFIRWKASWFLNFDQSHSCTSTGLSHRCLKYRSKDAVPHLFSPLFPGLHSEPGMEHITPQTDTMDLPSHWKPELSSLLIHTFFKQRWLFLTCNVFFFSDS
jgi:hypothetical protein